jgi:hypothetical protein
MLPKLLSHVRHKAFGDVKMRSAAPMMTRSGALKLVPLVLVILIAALPAGASAETIRRSFGNWTASFSGTFDYDWSEPAMEPCAENGDGSVRARFSGRLGRFGISYVRAGAFRAFGLINNTTRVHGSATVTDDRTINPPPPDGSPCDRDTIDKSGCGTRRYEAAMFSLDSTSSEQRPPLRMTVDLGGMLNAFARAGECYPAGLQDFGYFPGNSPLDSDTRDWDTRLGVLVGPRLRRADFARREAFAVSAQDTHRSVELPAFHTSTARRVVKVTFTPVGDQLSAEELAPASVPVLHRGGFRVRLFPPWATARSFEWQMKRASPASQWTTLGITRTPIFPFTFRLAGNFKVRTIAHGASAGGHPRNVISGAKPLEVKFPTWRDIVADQAVQSFTLDTWGQTLRLATPASRQEIGFWITLDTCSRKYFRTKIRVSRPAGPEEDASLRLGPRPADMPKNPPAVEGCATYTVASFHTHTPTTYRTPFGAARPVGPSPTDESFDRGQMVPGVVFDYIEDPPGSKTIPFGYPKEKPAQRYRSGLVRRPTPRR